MARAGQDHVRLTGPAGLGRYQRSWLRSDLLAGVTVAAYLVPQVMAYAVVAGLHPEAGLWAAVPALVIYALIGWFLVSATAAEEQAARASAALAGVTVADVMTPHLDLAPDWSTVGDFIDQVAAQSRQDAFPVVDPGGRLAGLVLAGQLARVPAADRHALTVSQVALAVPPAYLAAPGDPAAPLLRRRPLGGQVAAVVLADGRVAGLVTMTDLGQALRWRGLDKTTSG